MVGATGAFRGGALCLLADAAAVRQRAGMGLSVGGSLLSDSSTPRRADEAPGFERVAFDCDRDRRDRAPADAADAGGGEGDRPGGERCAGLSPLAVISTFSRDGAFDTVS